MKKNVSSTSHRFPELVQSPTGSLKVHPNNPRLHTPKQIGQIAESIRKFGFINPILIDRANNVLAGHGRLAAAKLLGLLWVPTICITHLSPAEQRAYMIADNRLGDLSSFDRKRLAAEVSLILADEPDFELGVMGFEDDEIELLLDGDVADPAGEQPAPPPERSRPALSQLGDVWQLGRHKLLCGNALERESYLALMGRERARMVFADPPYNVPASAISGKGKVVHGDFAMGSAELSEGEFIAFLSAACSLMARFSVNGALHYVCMDWRHQYELLAAARAVYDRQLDLCVWTKAQPGMGSPYRQQHELIAVFKHGSRPHVNNIELGRHGRNRSNWWPYASGPGFSAKRQEELSWHPTVKPLALVHDALLDASRRDDLVLDPFGGAGTTLIAAEQAGRQARMIELDPYYCDVIIRRFEGLTGVAAKTADGESLADREAQRDHAAREQGGEQ